VLPTSYTGKGRAIQVLFQIGVDNYPQGYFNYLFDKNFAPKHLNSMSGHKKRLLRINIRTLAEITFQEGSLGGAPSAPLSAALGIEIHRKYQSRDIEGYQSEVPLGREYEGEHIILEISGKADGVYATGEGVHIEEIKTMRTGGNEIANVHLAQLKLYGYFYSLDNNLKSIFLDLIYYNRLTEEEKIFSQEYSFETLANECLEWITVYLLWNDRNEGHRRELKSRIREFAFPYNEFRKGQYELSKAVFRAIRDRRILFAEAPTGTGKTAAVLYPALKAAAEDHTDKIFYLTAKTAGGATAEKTAEIFNSAGLGLRWITITAKARICFTNGDEITKPDCDPDNCPFSKNYYNRSHEALERLYSENAFNRECVEAIAREFTICPFELSLDLSLFCDLIICDYNHAFDLQSKLQRFFTFGKTNHTFLIDEAHNMIDRARAMFSSSISKSQIMALKKGSNPVLKKALTKFNAEFIALKKQYGIPAQICEPGMPASFLKIARKCRTEFDLFLEKHGRLSAEDMLLYWQLLEFNTIAEHYSASYRTVVKISAKDVSVHLRCIDPAEEIEAVLNNQRSAVFFSATLSPAEYYRSLLTPTMESSTIALASPFDPHKCLHFMKTDLSTRYKFRDDNSSDYAQLVRKIITSVSGNIVVFSPSFKFQSGILASLEIAQSNDNSGNPDRFETAVQTPQMSAPERDEFIGRFHLSRNLKAFCVCGGSFSESIDLPGEKLIGVIVFGVGLPQINFDNDIIKDFFEQKYGCGYQFAYMFPGFNKVLQAAGRVIRSEDDRGFVILVDDRYNTSDYRSLIPPHWKTRRAGDIDTVISMIADLLK